jgi:hypothetical protein
MESPKIVYQRLKKITNIKDYSYERLYENYLKNDLKGSKKLIEIDSTDQESVLNKLSKIPFPGMIYTFYHLNDKIIDIIQNIKSGKQIEFHDVAPILFCTFYHNNTHTIGGINMNLLPEAERLKFLEGYYQYYREFFEDVEQLTENNKEAINKKYLILALSGKGQTILKTFNKKYDALFDYGYRSYKFENIRKLRMLEYEEWNFIPFFSPIQAFKKINLQTIYDIYWINKNKTI